MFKTLVAHLRGIILAENTPPGKGMSQKRSFYQLKNKFMSLTADQWAKLVNQGRAKAIGVPWSDEEAQARANGVSAEDIRSGIWKRKIDVSETEINTSGTTPAKISGTDSTGMAPIEEKPKTRRGRKPKIR